MSNLHPYPEHQVLKDMWPVVTDREKGQEEAGVR